MSEAKRTSCVIRYISADGLEKVEYCLEAFQHSLPTYLIKPCFFPIAAWQNQGAAPLPNQPRVFERRYQFTCRHEATDRIEFIYREIEGR